MSSIKHDLLLTYCPVGCVLQVWPSSVDLFLGPGGGCDGCRHQEVNQPPPRKPTDTNSQNEGVWSASQQPACVRLCLYVCAPRCHWYGSLYLSAVKCSVDVDAWLSQIKLAWPLQIPWHRLFWHPPCDLCDVINVAWPFFEKVVLQHKKSLSACVCLGCEL